MQSSMLPQHASTTVVAEETELLVGYDKIKGGVMQKYR